MEVLFLSMDQGGFKPCLRISAVTEIGLKAEGSSDLEAGWTEGALVRN